LSNIKFTGQNLPYLKAFTLQKI